VNTRHSGNVPSVIQFLTPVRAALAQVAEGDAAVKTLVMAKASNSASQIDATKNSQMYSGGKVDSFRALYESVCNFRLLCSLASNDPDRSLLVQKLVEYTDILVDFSGKSFWEAHRNHPHLAIHAYQDLQHILSAFVVVATNSTLSKSVDGGNQVTLGNYSTALAVTNGHVHNLQAVVNGNGLGSFRDVPHCSTWFGHSPSPTQSTPIPAEGATGVHQTPVVLPPGVLLRPTWPKSLSDCAPSDPSNLMPLLPGPGLISWIRSLSELRSEVAVSPSVSVCTS